MPCETKTYDSVRACVRAYGQETDHLDADLAEVAAAWGDLPEAIKAGVLAMIRAISGERAQQRAEPSEPSDRPEG